MATFLSQPYASCLGSEKNSDNKRISPFRHLDSEIYFYRDIECTEKEKVRSAQHCLKVYEKSTISSRARSRKTIRHLEHAIERDTETIEKIPSLNWALAFAQFCQSDKQSIADYINEQKELFLLEYRVKVKQCTMTQLEKLAAKEERRAKIAEMKLEEDTLAFEEFLRENDRSSVDALKIATQETKSKLELTSEVNAAMNEVFATKSDIAITEEILRQYLSYETFLMSISPQDWQEKQLEKRGKMKPEKRRMSKPLLPRHEKLDPRSQRCYALGRKLSKGIPAPESPYGKNVLNRKPSSLMDQDHKKKLSVSSVTDYRFFRSGSKGDTSRRPSLLERRRSVLSCASEKTTSSDEDFSLEDIPSDVEPEIYFKDPEELLQMFRYLEEQNLTLFQNIQDLVGTMEDCRQRERIVREQMEQKIKSLMDEKDAIIAACKKEEEKCDELALKAKVFCAGQYNPAAMDKILDTLNKKVAQVYKVCGEESEVSSLPTFQMLKVIEIRVSQLCEMLEAVPHEYLDVIEATEKLRVKERRQRLREEKLEELKKAQEERLKLALKRAIAAPKKRMGRKLMYRSQPPETKQGKEQAAKDTTRVEDDYFFN
ncbi:coiled-coil domain-containing protein 38 [Heteronotia binoei]|uniref:coiled-coil domain-containing protein 38 n=1 Tax=Heteronotia binoei TaxID=13085 RepID=UPI00292F5146|nr:coiled-coil domain-containing protein 38 [Heteronotia binoei]